MTLCLAACLHGSASWYDAVMWSLKELAEHQTNSPLHLRGLIKVTMGFDTSQVNGGVSHWNAHMIPESLPSTSCLINCLSNSRLQRPTHSKRNVSFQVHTDLTFMLCDICQSLVFSSWSVTEPEWHLEYKKKSFHSVDKEFPSAVLAEKRFTITACCGLRRPKHWI